ncbi:MAG: hypothetical protein K5874_01165 [Bacteroidaceae bacterium]|nr:hypothetical protein [Bacteroidaceae bacterium]
MNNKIKPTNIFIVLKTACVILASAFMFSCVSHPDVPENYTQEDKLPEIFPDYTDVVVPPNIAPLNFLVKNTEEVVARFTYGNTSLTYGEKNKVMIDEKEWKELLSEAKGNSIKVEVFARNNNEWKAYKSFNISIAEENIDQYISYRLIYPSYVAYEMLSINQRDLTSFEEKDIYNNEMVQSPKDNQCINCHSYQNYKTDNMQFHIRQNLGGTMIVHNGKIQKVDLASDSTISAGVYPSWHPTLPLIAYSTNFTRQAFHTRNKGKIEVIDTKSDLILYDIEKQQTTTISGYSDEMESFPCWSPKGDMLYYCSAHFENNNDSVPIEAAVFTRYKEIQYDIYRKPFNQKNHSFGDAELVYEASADNLSATFPRISPDGKYLLFAMAHDGCFHVWHPDADLYMMDINTKNVRKLENVNSDKAESFHAWSSNGRWIIFVSRRDDGNYSRLYIAYIDKQGKAHKAFELPQRDPNFYTYFMRSYNVPEFMTEPVKITPHEFAAAIKNEAIKTTYQTSGRSRGAQGRVKSVKQELQADSQKVTTPIQ